jgi:hypothetical protein
VLALAPLYFLPCDTAAPLNRSLRQGGSTHEDCGGVATGWVRAALGLGEMLALNISSLFRRARTAKYFL